MHTIQHLQEMLAEHKEWQGKINFYKEEIIKLNAELEEFVLREKSKELLAQVEHFQNQFIRQREVLDMMRHDFKQHENAIEGHTLNPLQNLAAMHMAERDKLVQFEKIFRQLREEFHSFLHNKALF
jgi:hypothetical protein